MANLCFETSPFLNAFGQLYLHLIYTQLFWKWMNTNVVHASSSFIKISQHITCILFLAYKDFSAQGTKVIFSYSLTQG